MVVFNAQWAGKHAGDQLRRNRRSGLALAAVPPACVNCDRHESQFGLGSHHI
jgi:hypothetical protein